MKMRPSPVIRTAVGAVLLMAVAVTAWAQPDEESESPSGILPVPEYAGDWKERAHLLGDPGEARSRLAEAGIQLQIDWTQTLQSVVEGGLEEESEYGGSVDTVVLFDLDRMGLVPGGLVKIRGESRYGESVNSLTGQILPASTNALTPLTDELDEDIFLTLTTASYTQFLSDQFGIVIGKIDNLDSNFNEFASGRGISQFQNASFVFSPATINEPLSTLGAGVVWMPDAHMTLTSFAYNLTDSSTTSGFSDIGDGWTWATELYFQYRLAGLPGGSMLAGAFNFDADFTEIGSTRLVLDPSGGIMLDARSDDDAWAAYANAWQYLWTAEETEGPINLEDGLPDHRGIGAFLRAGTGDSSVNPVDWTLSGGIGGRGLFAARELDTLGVGVFHTRIQSTRLTGALDIDDESRGIEAYYGFALTPAAHLTFDIQALDSPLPDVDTAVVVGARLSMRF